MSAELGCWFINGEPRRIGRYLKQNSPWLAEIDRMEILSIDNGRDIELPQRIAPEDLLFVSRGTPRHVVNSTDRHAASTAGRGAQNIDDGSGSTIGNDVS